VIREQASDDRNYVKKAVSWALRQIGKRSAELNARTIRTAEQIERTDARPARWIARTPSASFGAMRCRRA
jgi:3-methyladenine DNA glycosylase AlkD